MFCRRCGGRVLDGALVCPECGARQRRHASSFRCAYCRGSVTVGMTVCPHCGRDARPAGPRWGLWLLGLLVVVLCALWGLGRLPVHAVRQTLTDARANLQALVQLTDLLTPVPTPSAQASVVVGASPYALAWQGGTPTGGATAALQPSRLPELSTPTATPAPSPTASSVPTSSLASPTPLPTVESPGLVSVVTPTPSPTSARRYRVQSGDTLEAIGERFNVPWGVIAAANRITADTVLQIDQELIIPMPGATPEPTAMPQSRPTPAPASPTVTALPTIAAPLLENPADQASFSGENALIELKWRPNGPLPPGAEYQVTVSYVRNGVPLENSWTTSSTAARLPLWLWGLADQPARRYTWFVTVVQITTDGRGGKLIIPLGPSSASRTLFWN